MILGVVLFALAVFVVAAVTDAVWAHYTHAVAELKPAAAALWAAAIIACGVVSFGAYKRSLWYGVPTALGAAAGTYLTVERKRSKASL